MVSEQHLNLHFESKALEPDTFKVVRFEGVEEISRCYRFEIELVSDRADIDLAALLGQPAHLALRRGDDGEPRKLHGILAEFEQGREGAYGHYFYRAVLVPRLWLLSLSSQNQIYQGKSVIEIVEEELKGAADKGPAEMAAIGLTSDDFEFRLSGDYVSREYVVQYQETDLDFICRWLEHEGVFFYFEHDDDKEKIVFCDDNVHLPKIDDGGRIAYNLPSGTSSALEESVQALTCRQAQITAKMIVKDYNYRTPTTPLQGEAQIDDAGHGLVSEYGNHFKTPEEGQGLAKVRAQEIRCAKMAYRGESDALGLAAGRPFALEDHFRDDFNQEYANIRVHHVGSQSFAEATGFTEVDGQATSYRNDFTAIPLSVPFRPARRTPKSKLHGVMNGHVDAEGPGSRAEIDGEGRYKLVMPFDLGDQAEGKATRWVRMAQPYGGGQHGMHFPLLKGTEVIWTCVDGDPDRPIITGVVPNPLNKSMINADSHTKNRIQTASGILMEFQDGPGTGGGNPAAGAGTLAGQRQMQRAVPSSGALRPQRQLAHAPKPKPAAQDPDYTDQGGDTDQNTRENKWFRFHVPDFDGSSPAKHSYLRHGRFPNDASAQLAEQAAVGANPDFELHLNKDGEGPAELAHHLDGVFDFTDGNRTEITHFNREVVIGGKSRMAVGDKKGGTAYIDEMKDVGRGLWRHTVAEHTSKDTYQWGDTESFFAGAKFIGFAGLKTSFTIGGAVSVGVDANVDFGSTFKVNVNYGSSVSLVPAGQNTMDAKNHDIRGIESINLRIKGMGEDQADVKFRDFAKKNKWALTALTTSVLTGGFGSGLIFAGDADGNEAPVKTWGARAGFTVAAVTWAAGIAAGLAHKMQPDLKQKASPAMIDIQKDLIKLVVGPQGPMETAIVMKPGSITLKSGKTEIYLGATTGVIAKTTNNIAMNATRNVRIQGKAGTSVGGLSPTVSVK